MGECLVGFGAHDWAIFREEKTNSLIYECQLLMREDFEVTPVLYPMAKGRHDGAMIYICLYVQDRHVTCAYNSNADSAGWTQLFQTSS